MSEKVTEFSNGKTRINVKTVGEMIQELSLLPPTLSVESTFCQSADLVVFNVNAPELGVCLQVCDAEDEDEERYDSQ